jgi:hypothetical protein
VARTGIGHGRAVRAGAGAIDGVIPSDSGERLEVLSGILGSGRTSILRHLNDSRAYPLRVQLEDFNPGHHGHKETRRPSALAGKLPAVRGAAADANHRGRHNRLPGRVPRTRSGRPQLRSARRQGRSNQGQLRRSRSPLAPKDLAHALRTAATLVSDKF